MALVLAAMAWQPAAGMIPATVLLAALGFFGSAYPAIMAHWRSFLPRHLIGRGVSFINMFGIGGAGLLQFTSRQVYRAAESPAAPGAAFSAIFLFFLAPLVLGLAAYLFSRNVRA